MKPPAWWLLLLVCIGLTIALVFAGIQIAELEERQDRVERIIGFIGRGAVITHDYERGVGWIDNYSIFQSNGAPCYSIDPNYPDATYFEGSRQWANFTIDCQTLDVIHSSWVKYAYSPQYEAWVLVQFYTM